MLILNYHFDRFLYFDTREDRVRCDTTIVAEFEGERITFNCEFYCEVASSSSHRAFEKKLVDKLPFALNAYNHGMDVPEFLVCNRHLYYIEKADAIRKYAVTPFSYAIDHPEHVKVIPLPEDWNSMQRCMTLSKQNSVIPLLCNVRNIVFSNKFPFVDIPEVQIQFLFHINP